MGLKANADGSGAIQVGGSDAITITSGLNTTFAGTVQASGLATNLYPLIADTAKTAPPTVPQYFEFTGIPSWVKRITVMFNGVSLSGSSNFLIQLGDAGGIENTGYVSTAQSITGGVGGGNLSSTAGMIMSSGGAAVISSGHMILTLISSNIWISSHVVKLTTTASGFGGGDKTLSDVLTQIRITTVNGSDTFDAGSINILYE